MFLPTTETTGKIAARHRVNKNDVVDETRNYQRIQCTTPAVKWVVYVHSIPHSSGNSLRVSWQICG